MSHTAIRLYTRSSATRIVEIITSLLEMGKLRVLEVSHLELARAGFELRSLWLSDQGLPEFHLLGRLLKGGLLIRSFPARPGNLEPIFYV